MTRGLRKYGPDVAPLLKRAGLTPEVIAERKNN